MPLSFDINDEPVWTPPPCPATDATEEPHLRCWLQAGHDDDHYDIEHGLSFS